MDDVAVSLPMVGEVPARERLIEAASRLFCRYGINAVGVDTVVAEAGTAKATLYKAFGSKEKLVEAVLEHPSDRRADRRGALVQRGGGYEGVIVDAPNGEWTLQIKASLDGELLYETRNRVTLRRRIAHERRAGFLCFRASPLARRGGHGSGC